MDSIVLLQPHYCIGDVSIHQSVVAKAGIETVRFEILSYRNAFTFL